MDIAAESGNMRKVHGMIVVKLNYINSIVEMRIAFAPLHKRGCMAHKRIVIIMIPGND